MVRSQQTECNEVVLVSLHRSTTGRASSGIISSPLEQGRRRAPTARGLRDPSNCRCPTKLGIAVISCTGRPPFRACSPALRFCGSRCLVSPTWHLFFAREIEARARSDFPLCECRDHDSARNPVHADAATKRRHLIGSSATSQEGRIADLQGLTGEAPSLHQSGSRSGKSPRFIEVCP